MHLCVSVYLCVCLLQHIPNSTERGRFSKPRKTKFFSFISEAMAALPEQKHCNCCTVLAILGILSLRFKYYIIIEYNFLLNFCSFYFDNVLMKLQQFHPFMLIADENKCYQYPHFIRNIYRTDIKLAFEYVLLQNINML